MNSATALRKGVSLEEFLAIVEASDEKHILWDGEVYQGGGLTELVQPAHRAGAASAASSNTH